MHIKILKFKPELWFFQKSEAILIYLMVQRKRIVGICGSASENSSNLSIL